VSEAQPYEIAGPIGEGGVAEVFLARCRSTGAPVALKRLRRDLLDAPTSSALRREARLASTLDHPNIVKLREVGDDDGVFLAFEYVAGWDLARVLAACAAARRPPPIEAALHVARCVGLALGHAHGRGVLHRDVTPSNVLISPEGEVKLTDFGIARVAGSSPSTSTGWLKGKLPYLSPEQARGEPLDERSDLYALGIVLFEALTGERLFRAADEQALLAAVRAPRIPAPSARCPELPLDVDELLLAALSPAPSGRFPSAAAFCDAIDALASSLGLSPGPAALRALLASLPLPPPPSLPPLPASPGPHEMPSVTLTPPPAPASVPAPAPVRPRWPLAVALLVGLGLGGASRFWSHRPAPYSLQISSTPEGAAVVLDGQARGLTPLVIEAVAGEQPKIELRKPGFRPYVALLPRRNAPAGFVFVTLEPAP